MVLDVIPYGLCPVHDLPTELLQFVVLEAVDSHYQDHERLFQAIAISQTCSRWRNVAISIPSLWTNLTRHYPTWVPTQLERTNQDLLSLNWRDLDNPSTASSREKLETAEESEGSVSLSSGSSHSEPDASSAPREYKPNMEVLRLALQNVERLKSLALNLDYDDLHDALSYLYRPTPLRNLYIEYETKDGPASRTVRRHRRYQGLVYLDPSLFAGFAELRSIYLIDLFIDLSRPMPHWPHLTHLHISSIQVHWSSREPSLYEFIRVLSNFPRLEYLHLPRVYFGRFHMHASTLMVSETVSLPHLKMLHLSFPHVKDAFELSRRVSVHPECEVHYIAGRVAPDPALTFGHLSALLPRGKRRALRALSLQGLIGWVPFWLEIYGEGSSGERVMIELEFECGPPEFASAVARGAFAMHDLSQVRALHITVQQVEGDVWRDIWDEVFGTCGSAESVTLGSDLLVAFIHRMEGCELPYSGLPDALFPRCRAFDFPGISDLSQEEKQRLVTVLKARRDNGYELEMLTIPWQDLDDDVDYSACAATVVRSNP